MLGGRVLLGMRGAVRELGLGPARVAEDRPEAGILIKILFKLLKIDIKRNVKLQSDPFQTLTYPPATGAGSQQGDMSGGTAGRISCSGGPPGRLFACGSGGRRFDLVVVSGRVRGQFYLSSLMRWSCLGLECRLGVSGACPDGAASPETSRGGSRWGVGAAFWVLRVVGTNVVGLLLLLIGVGRVVVAGIFRQKAKIKLNFRFSI